jgi:O-antigen ligase
VDAWEYFKQSPLFGNGVGYFEKFHSQSYVHEFFLEILCEYGIVGFIFVLGIMFRYTVRVYNDKLSEGKIFSLVLAGISFLLLLYSSSYWLMPQFWYFLFYMITYPKNKGGND